MSVLGSSLSIVVGNIDDVESGSKPCIIVDPENSF